MKSKKSSSVQICKTCGRIITEADNKTGICQKCQGKGAAVGGAAVLAIAVIVKVAKVAPKLIKNILKK